MIKQYDQLKEIKVTEQNTILFDPEGQNMNYKWSDKESALSYIASAYNNIVLNHEESSTGNLYNAILYIQKHCVETKKSTGELI